MVAVLDEVARRVETARTEVDRQHRLGAGLLAPVDELIDADVVVVAGAPGKIEPGGAALPWADAVFPVVG